MFIPRVETLIGGGCSPPTRPWSSPCRVNPMIKGPISRCTAQGTQCEGLESPTTKEAKSSHNPGMSLTARISQNSTGFPVKKKEVLFRQSLLTNR
ncbi:hypothetical protein Q7C36_001364 [Tachysurus vachellii]|uniref:Uncharacterized protein n=1 Tax=Tachysurus vachellii TaxID=175792 RepID=A0AA88T9X9_TACVA|nr:hypothetical protein Q7C36_001364 [Tachysurus vachellii]